MQVPMVHTTQSGGVPRIYISEIATTNYDTYVHTHIIDCSYSNGLSARQRAARYVKYLRSLRRDRRIVINTSLS